jgi:hypothetical protein
VIETFYHAAKATVSLPMALRTTGDPVAAVDGTAVAWGAYRAAGVLILAGTITDGTHTVEIQESADNVTYTAVPDGLLDGAEPALVAANSDTLTLIGYRGTAKYLRASITVTDVTATGGSVAALIVALHPYQQPGPR